VTALYEGHRVAAVHDIVVSTQIESGLDPAWVTQQVSREIIDPLLGATPRAPDFRVWVNPAGPFEIGGPHGDTGLTGRKIIVDTYGGACPHGGGAFSGKDPSKVDRSAAYMARYIARNIVAAGLARRCLVQIAYAIGVAEPVSVMIDTQDTGSVTAENLEAAVRKVFRLTPSGIIAMLDLARPIYRRTAAYGHFGRSDIDLSWERTDRIAALHAALS
jgi:S-adenosylmethionine synthetase